MDYKILSFDTSSGVIIAAFGAIVSHVEVPIVNGAYDISNIDTLIRASVPADKLARLDAIKEGDVSGTQAVLAIVEPPAPMTDEQVIYGIVGYVQYHMDRTAQNYGYDDIKSAVTYADEPIVQKYQIEGQAFRAWRSLVWDSCTKTLFDFQSGTIPKPTAQEVVDGLPAFVIPE